MGVLKVYDGSGWNAVTINSDHGTLGGLTDDDHTQYSLVDGTRDFTGDVSGPAFKGTSTTDSTVINKLTTVQRDALTAVEGMMIYNTDTDYLESYNGTIWKKSVKSSADYVHTWKFSTDTSSANPGSTFFRFNHATQASATEMYVNATNFNGMNIAAMFSNVSDGDSLRVQSSVDPDTWFMLSIDSDISNNGSWVSIPISVYDNGPNELSNDDEAIIVYNNTKTSWTPIITCGLNDAQSVDSATDTAINWNTEDIKDSIFFSHSTSTNPSRITARGAGRYKITAKISVTGTTTNYRLTNRVAVRVNGTTTRNYLYSGYVRANVSSDSLIECYDIVDLAKSDYIEIMTARVSTTTGDGTTVANKAIVSVEKIK